MNIDIKNLPESPEILHKIIVDLHASLHLEKDKYSRLLEQFKLSRQQQFSPASEKNILQPDFFDEPGALPTEEIITNTKNDIEVISEKNTQYV